MKELESKRARVERRARVREFVFGAQDGILSTVCLATGLAGATGSAA